MEYVHVRNLERFHPGYRDRQLLWAKIHFGMIQGDPEIELIKNEIDKWRFVGLICLELRAQKPLPNDDEYWRRYFDIKNRPMSKTLNALHNFLDLVTEETESCTPDKSKSRVDKSRVEESTEEKEKILTLAENVKMSETEYEKLLLHFGGEDIRARAVEILDNYKGSSGRKYKSDYRTILGWVTDKIKQEVGNAKFAGGGAKHSGSKAGGATTADDLARSLEGLKKLRARERGETPS